MNKKLLAVAIGAALSAPMLAQADVKVSGQAHLSLDYIDAYSWPTGTPDKWMNVSSNSSFIRFEADEDLGGGMKGIVSITEYVRMDHTAGLGTSTGTGTAPLNTSYWYVNTRNSNRLTDGNAYAGISGGFGKVLLGSNDTQAKINARSVDLFNNQIGDSRNMDANNSRLQNMVSYSSPTFFGVTVTLAHYTNVDNSLGGVDQGWYTYWGGGSTAYASAGTFAKANSVGVNYKQGPLYVGVAMDTVIPIGSYGGLEEQKWMNVAASFDIGPASIKAMYQQHDNAGWNTLADKKTMGLGASFKIGENNKVKVQYYTLSDDRANRDASMYAVGFDHNFSKNTMAYVAYANTENDPNANYSMAAGGHGDQPYVATGDTMNGLSLGVIVNF